jgi:hypothetical protein
MPKTQSVRIQDHFAELTDPRRREVTYPLINIVVIALCGVICGADDFVAIAKFGRTKRDWLAKFLDLSAGIPSHDRFNAVLAMIKPAQFEQCLLSWITALHDITDGQVVAIDGKTLRRSFDTASSKSAIHMVSAWATANQISLGQVAGRLRLKLCPQQDFLQVALVPAGGQPFVFDADLRGRLLFQ